MNPKKSCKLTNQSLTVRWKYIDATRKWFLGTEKIH